MDNTETDIGDIGHTKRKTKTNKANKKTETNKAKQNQKNQNKTKQEKKPTTNYQHTTQH